ncbi:glycosyltransferase [Candidatus Saccharibacteria bacterium]|nr:glycosyltransferase [Candidatus Saccharibacteria bacterium]
MWFSNLNLKDYDIVISASGAEAKGVKTKGHTKHISYIHAPTHYYWSRYDQYINDPGFGRFDQLARFGLRKLVGPMRKWDFRAAQRPDVLLANSSHTQEQILKYYHRDSKIIHPPIRTKKFNKYCKNKKDRAGFIVVGRQTPYKRIDLAVRACSSLGKDLTVVGNGPENTNLKQLAGPSVMFIDQVNDDDELATLLGTAEGFIFPTNAEDFGIAPVEALAAGTPVIAYKAGGPLDYIKPGVNGDFFNRQSVKALKEVLSKFKPEKYTQSDIKRSADSFSTESFRKKITKAVNSL